MTIILTEETAKTAQRAIRAVALAAHPEKGSACFDVLMENNCRPIGGRIRRLISDRMGADWTVFDWETCAPDCF